MKVLLSFNGLVRNFKETFIYIENNVIKNNVDCSFDIILNTSTHDNQISSKWKKSKIHTVTVQEKSWKIIFFHY